MNFLKLSVTAIMILVLCVPAAVAEDMGVTKSPLPGCTGEGVVKTPESSVEEPGDIGKRAHTNIKIFVPPCPSQSEVHPGAGSSGEAPTPDASPPR